VHNRGLISLLNLRGSDVAEGRELVIIHVLSSPSLLEWNGQQGDLSPCPREIQHPPSRAEAGVVAFYFAIPKIVVRIRRQSM
jgi:hypothetical protein